MANPLRRYVPGHFHNPLGLAARLVRSRNADAWYAMGLAAVGVAISPLDWALSFSERGRTQADTPQQPLLFVCGPPRSGTTLVYQTLIRHLPVAYFNNLAALFPRSPLAAQGVFGSIAARRSRVSRSFYGRTRGLGGSSDALHLWDRWLGANRLRPPEALSPEAAESMRRFLNAYAKLQGAPLVGKNNNLNASAHLVAEALPNCRFICLGREPLYLAQSLYQARLMIHGDAAAAYGLAPESLPGESPEESVCRQVRHHKELEHLQAERLGEERFWRVSYEEFCADPTRLVRRVADELLDWQSDKLAGLQVEPYKTSNRQRLDDDVFDRLKQAWENSSTNVAAATTREHQPA